MMFCPFCQILNPILFLFSDIANSDGSNDQGAGKYYALKTNYGHDINFFIILILCPFCKILNHRILCNNYFVAWVFLLRMERYLPNNLPTHVVVYLFCFFMN